MVKHVPFDPDWYAIGLLEPEFVTEIVGWANAEMLVDVGMLPLMSASSLVPVAWTPGAFKVEPLPKPEPVVRRTLKWILAD